MPGTGIDVEPKLPKWPVPVWKSVPVPAVPVSMSYPTDRSVRYRYWCRTQLTEVSGTGVNVVPKLPICPVPVLMSYLTYRSVRYRYWCRTELTEVSGTGIDVVPKLPKCPVPVIPAVYTGGMLRYVAYRTHLSLYAVQKVPFGLSTEREVNKKNVVSLNFERRQALCISWADSYASPIPSFMFWWGRKNKPFRLRKWTRSLVVRYQTRRWFSGHLDFLLVWFFSTSVRFLDKENSSERRILLCLTLPRAHFALPWTQASKPALTDSSLAAKRRAEALHLVFFSTKHPSPPRWPTYCCCCVCTLVWDVATKDARWVRCSSWSLGPRPRPPTAS